jgi:signal peptidase II
MKKKLSYLYGILLATLLVVIDQVTKYFARTCLTDDKTFDVIKKVLRFNYVKNTGAAWGMMSGKQTLFIILTAVMLIGIVFLYVKAPEDKKFTPLRITMAVLAGGAIGNFIDRVSKGYVDDFIDFHLINFPVFNFADICVCISMFVLVFLIIFKYKDDDFNFLKFKKNNKEQERDSDKTT